MTTFNIFLVLIVVVCLLLALVIMVQNPKGGGLSSTFGGNTQVVGGVKKTGDFLETQYLDICYCFGCAYPYCQHLNSQ